MKADDVRQQVHAATQAAESKKAADIAILEMDKDAGAFTDYFLICSGSNPRQIQAISDEVEQQLARAGVRANQVEGYKQAEWVLLDYVDFVVHVFNENARKFYDLERLWRSAKRLSASELLARRARKSAPKSAKAKAPAKAVRKSGPRKTKRKSAPAKATSAKSVRKTATRSRARKS